MTFLTEIGLYEVLFRSRKPIAKKFKKHNLNTSTRVLKDSNFLVDCGAKYSGPNKISINGKRADIGYYNIKFKDQ